MLADRQLEHDLSAQTMLLITSGARSSKWRNHFKRHHPPDTIMIYHQACQALSKSVIVLPIDEFVNFANSEYIKDDISLIVNISGGLWDLDLASIIPSLGRHIGVPVFPASTKQFTLTHDKLFCKYVAHNCDLQIAKTFSGEDLISANTPVIEKPICGGDSVGIKFFSRYPRDRILKPGFFVEEFIPGYDATIHLKRKEDLGSYVFLDHLVSEQGGEQWFDSIAKNNANRIYAVAPNSAGRTSRSNILSDELASNIAQFMRHIGLPYIARVDLRQYHNRSPIGLQDCIFLEVNVTPTISNANDWFAGLQKHFQKEMHELGFEDMPIHPAAKSLAFLIRDFYFQSLSMHKKI